MEKSKLSILFFLTIVLVNSFPAWPVISGKITGTITNIQTGESIFGANVIIEGTTLGAAADGKSHYTILEIPPGI